MHNETRRGSVLQRSNLLKLVAKPERLPRCARNDSNISLPFCI